jgi:hypothetical protein
MSTEGHKAAMQADYSPTLDESIDPPPYIPETAMGWPHVLAAWAVAGLLAAAIVWATS